MLTLIGILLRTLRVLFALAVIFLSIFGASLSVITVYIIPVVFLNWMIQAIDNRKAARKASTT